MKTLDLFEQNNFPELQDVSEKAISALLSRLGVQPKKVYLERESQFTWSFQAVFSSEADRAEAWKTLKNSLKFVRYEDTNMFCPEVDSPLTFVEKIYTSPSASRFEMLVEVTK